MIIALDDFKNRSIEDEVIAFQTDTVYGIGCRFDSVKGADRIYEIKHRDKDKPLAVLCPDIESAASFFHDASVIRTIGRKYWPGALTLVAAKGEKAGDHLTKGRSTIGVRIPDDPLALEILRVHGPLAATSLNMSDEPPVHTFEEALQFESAVDYLVEGGTARGVSSTVYDVEKNIVLRQGDVVIDKKVFK